MKGSAGGPLTAVDEPTMRIGSVCLYLASHPM
jgi:hypothetical protein